MQIDGQFYASTTIGTHKCNIRYIVSPDIQESIIIGTDLLQAMKATISLEDFTLKIKDIIIPLRLTRRPPRTCRIQVLETISIPPEITINGRLLNQSLADANSLGVCNSNSVSQYVVVRTLVRSRDHLVPITIVNGSDQDVQIKEGTSVADFQPITSRGISVQSINTALIENEPGETVFFSSYKSPTYRSTETNLTITSKT